VSDPKYSSEPTDAVAFTKKHDGYYTSSAGLYEAAVRRLPVWKTWLGRALPHIEGPRVLEVSFGTGYLLARMAGRVEAHGVDYNRKMAETAAGSVRRSGHSAALVQANVERLPYRDDTFDSLVNTMAFSGYPDGRKALSEMTRVLRPGGKMVLIDIGFPANRNWFGTQLAEFWKLSGDLVRDMGTLFDDFGLVHTDEEIGGAGSVHLYVATKASTPP